MEGSSNKLLLYRDELFVLVAVLLNLYIFQKLWRPTSKLVSFREYSTLPKPDRNNFDYNRGRSLPRLMNFPEVLWPSTLKTIKNWILVQFMIRPYFDSDFYIRDFTFGAKHALQIISSKLVNGDFLSLNNLVTTEVIEEIKPTIQQFSIAQRRQLEISKEDVYFAFPYEVGIIFDDSHGAVQKRWVEITMVFHVLRGLTQMREQGEQIPWNMGTMPEYQDKVFVCNYRFIKEFTAGNQSNWIVNALNHFKPVDLMNEK